MRKVLILIIYACAILLAPFTVNAAEPAVPANALSDEKISYNVYFHMGFIWAKAGYGELTFKKQTAKDGAQQYHGQLAAKSLSIVEHIMKVRDTLDCWFNDEMVPIKYRKGTHEGSYNAIANNTYTSYWHKKGAANTLTNVDSTQVKITRWRKKGKDEATFDTRDYSNTGVAYDMLTVFYSIRNLDYAHMTKGKKMQFVCYDGLDCQTINVEYQGAESCELRSGKKFDSFLVYLTFATKDQNSTPLKVWLSKDPGHRPIKAVIGLKRIGSVQCEATE